MKYFLIPALILVASLAPSKAVQAGNGSEACVTHCTDAASAHYEDGTAAWSAFFNGCMRMCWM